MNWELPSLFDDLSARTVLVTAVDLALVYYLIYRVLLVIKGTRAAQMVVGIVLIGAAFFASERLELTTVSWLLDNFISYVVIIVVVVFQQDLRRALGRIGQGVLPSGRAQAAGVLDEVVAAVAQMARARIGAIVVLERTAGVAELLEDATAIDARTTRQLLVSLFVPNRDNELHDGAVVIGRTGRIESARAVLPLSPSASLASALGTRHRAALGLSEESDAVAVVVSEERGEIRVAFRGELSEPLNAAELEKRIGTWIEQPPEPDDDVEPKVTGDPGRSSGARRVEADLQHPAEGGA
ncbi:MAG: diadenylate cyclase CdaA [Myxococcales bacterium]|nr:diadenylate cyclase CdaA [Myxococcales bacterium]